MREKNNKVSGDYCVCVAVNKKKLNTSFVHFKKCLSD